MLAIPHEDKVLEEFCTKGWNLYELRKGDRFVFDYIPRGPTNKLVKKTEYIIIPKSEFPENALEVMLLMGTLEEMNLYPPRIEEKKTGRLVLSVKYLKFREYDAVLYPNEKEEDWNLNLTYDLLVVVIKDLFKPNLLEKAI